MDNKMAVFNNREFGSIRVIEENGNYLFELPKMEKKSSRSAAQEPEA